MRGTGVEKSVDLIALPRTRRAANAAKHRLSISSTPPSAARTVRQPVSHRHPSTERHRRGYAVAVYLQRVTLGWRKTAAVCLAHCPSSVRCQLIEDPLIQT
jgi:hypothetical protein